MEIVDRCYKDVPVRLGPHKLVIGDETLKPEDVVHMEAVSSEVVLPREAMGMGDVKLAFCMGAFLGASVIPALFIGFVLGALVGAANMARRKATMKSALPFGPFLAVGGVIGLFLGPTIIDAYLGLALGK